MEVFGNKFDSCGVFYPLQTFSRGVPLDFSGCLFIPGRTRPSVTSEMRKNRFENITSRRPYGGRSELMWIHIAAVFACNFTNHMMYHSK